MHRYIVALDRPRGSAGSRGEAIEKNRQMTDRFRLDLDQVIKSEGLGSQIQTVNPTDTLPVLYVTGTEALAERVQQMTGVRSVAPDVEFDLPVGKVVVGR